MGPRSDASAKRSFKERPLLSTLSLPVSRRRREESMLDKEGVNDRDGFELEHDVI